MGAAGADTGTGGGGGLWFVVCGGDGQTCRDYVNSQ